MTAGGRIGSIVPVADRVNAERLVLLGWPRAILLQMAHPLIAAGVAGHSAFRANPVASARRLHHTVRAMLGLTFGTDAERERVIQAILKIHRSVNGRLSRTTGRFAAGTPYSAEDPALLLWVHLTLLESSLLVYDAVVAPLDLAARDEYCRDAASVALALGARDADVPRDWRALTDAIAAVRASGVLAVGDDARAIATAILHGGVTRVAGPIAWANRVLTVGWLPPDVREMYGFEWSDRQVWRSARLVWLCRLARRMMPDAIAVWPEARGTR